MPPLAGPATFRELYLFAFVAHGQLWQHLRTDAPAELGRLEELLDAWDAVQHRVDALREEPLPPRAASTLPLPAGQEERIDALATDPIVERTFADLPAAVEYVALDDLVAAQRTLDLDHVDALRAALGPQPSVADVVELCLSPTEVAAPTGQLELADGTQVFASDDPGLRVLGSVARPISPDDADAALVGGLPTFAVTTFIGVPTPVMNAYDLGDRLLLNNGFHRAYALRSLGVTHAPMIVQELRQPLQELPPYVLGVAREELLDRSRPVLLRDFFDPELGVVLRAQRRRRMVSVGLDVTSHDVPS